MTCAGCSGVPGSKSGQSPNRSLPGVRPLGSKNRHPATRYDVGKALRRPETIAERDQVRPQRTS
ncbi:hypothetical protein EJ357_02350 [Streptomyces cyaneochromogenes]|uniref:Uncharacterized protein n=1 Tax=Streptomyces cyaneochromogenes TaxID=2496836 RepID=A0A3S9LZT5_9ACTN|nr:hypothetical protein EJ357_02350 [Streptomyces cyaneochromogenes]